MPQIKEYEAPALGLRPTETGINAVAAAARRVQGEYNEAAAAKQGTGERLGSAIKVAGDIGVKAMEHREISTGAASFAELQRTLTEAWNKRAKEADPNDPSVAQKFGEEVVNPALEKFGQSFLTEGGQNWGQHHIAGLREHLFTKSSADMSSLAGHAVVLNQHRTINALSATVNSDPSSLDYSLGLLESSTEGVIGSSPNLSATDAGRVREELTQRGKEAIIKSAALGHIEKTGEMPKWIEDPKYAPYVNGAEMKTLAQSARYYKRMAENEEKGARVLQEHDDRSDFHSKVNELELSLLPKEVGDPILLPPDYWQKVRELGKHPGASLEPSRLAKLVHDGETITNRMNKPEALARVSRPTTVDLLNKMRATDGSRLTDNSAIYDAYSEGKLSNADFRFLVKEFDTMRSPGGQELGRSRTEFFKMHAPMIDAGRPMGGAPTALGAQRLYEAEMAARSKEEELRASGKNPGSVYDPTSPDYFGKPENIARFHVSMAQAMQYQKGLDAQNPRTLPAGTVKANQPNAPQIGERKQFKQGWGVWDGTQWVEEKK